MGVQKKKSPDFRSSEVGISAYCIFFNIKSDDKCIRLNSCIVVSPFASTDEYSAVTLRLCY